MAKTKKRKPKPVIREYPYRVGRGTSVTLLVLVTLGVFVLGGVALIADKGANLKGIELTAGQFRMLMGTMAVLGGLIAVPLMGWMVVDSFAGTRRVAFTEDSVILPKPSRSGMSKEEVELPFAEILVVRLTEFVGKSRAILIVYDHGQIMIPNNMLRADDFVEIGEALYSVAAERNDEVDDE